MWSLLVLLNEKRRRHTRVGTSDVGLKKVSIRSLVMFTPPSNIILRTRSILYLRSSLSTRASWIRCLVSVFVPISGMRDLRIRHRGHGQPAKYLRHAINILKQWEWSTLTKRSRLLTSLDNRLNRSKTAEKKFYEFHRPIERQFHGCTHA